MNRKFKKRKVQIYIILAVLLIIGMAFGVYAFTQKNAEDVFAEKPLENLTIKAVPNGNENEAITVFSTEQPSYQPLTLIEGTSYTLMLESDFENTSEVMIAYNSEKIKIAESKDILIGENSIRFSLSGKSSLQTEMTGSGSFFDGLTIENEYESTAYASSADFLQAEVGECEKKKTVVLLNDIDIETSLSINAPCNLLLNDRNLVINGDLIFETDMAGVFAVENTSSEQIKVKRFFTEAPNCDIRINKEFTDYNGALGYYINAKSYNGQTLEADCRTIKSAQMLLDLIHMEKYPHLKPNTTIVLDTPFTLEEVIQITVPVSFRVNAPVTANAPIVVLTRMAGSIKIEAESSTKDLFMIDAPECSLTWSGRDIPSVTEISEQMNVKTYNGEDMRQYGLGGNGEGRIVSFRLLKDKNIKAQEDLTWTVSGNVIHLSVSFLIKEEALRAAVLDIEVQNGTFSFNAESMNKDNTINLTIPCTCTVVDNEGRKRTYTVRTERVKFNLPVVSINTEGFTEITSKEVYKKAEISIDCPDLQFPSLGRTAVNIKGRGHSTWQWAKKPYKLKFDTNVSVLGLTAAKEWVLLANYSDKTLIRNYVATEMGKVLDNLDFTPTQYPVDLFVNGVYRGVYTLGEQIEADSGRVEIDKNYEETDTGYLLEVGGSDPEHVYDRDYFHAGTLKFVLVKSPNTDKISKEAFNYIKTYAAQADKAVISLTDYEEYIDIDSVIDWFILHELTYNIDSGFRRSCYLTKDKGGKLKMGPIWDFDLALGNFSKDNPKYDDWAMVGEDGGYVGVTWFNYLLKDEAFKAKLKARWNTVKDNLLKTAIAKIDEMARIIEPSQQYNFTVWQVWNVRTGYSPQRLLAYNTYEKQIQYLKDFLSTRYVWMDAKIMSM